jgi:hypothetical protein
LAALAAGACEDSPAGDGAPPADPFVGRWTCTETRTLTFATPPGSPDATTQSKYYGTASVVDDQLSIYGATTDAGACRLDFKKSGTSALLMDGQTCTTLDGIVLTYKSGTADVGVKGLETSLAFDFAGALAVDGGSPLDASGSGTTTTTCAKIVPPPRATSGATGGGGW